MGKCPGWTHPLVTARMQALASSLFPEALHGLNRTPVERQRYFLTPESSLTSGLLPTNGRDGCGSNGVRAQHQGWPVGRWEVIWRETPVHPNQDRYKPVSQLSNGMPARTSQVQPRPKNPDQPLTNSRCKQETAMSCVSRLWGGLLPGGKPCEAWPGIRGASTAHV